MKPTNFLLFILASLMLLACSPDSSPKPKLFEEQRSALDKAKAVDDVMQKQTQQLQQNLDKQSQ